RQQFQQGNITTPQQLKEFLEQEAGRFPKQALPKYDNRRVSNIIKGRGLKQEDKDARAEAKAVRDRLREIGVAAGEINGMTLAQARQSLQQFIEDGMGGRQRPKTEAPAPQEDAGAVEQQVEAQETEVVQEAESVQETVQQEHAPTDIQGRVRLQFAGRFADPDIDSITEAVELAQQDNMEPLRELIAEFREDGLLEQEDTRFLNTISREEYNPPREVLESDVRQLLEDIDEGALDGEVDLDL